MSLIKMTDLDLDGKRVLIRADLNVPIKAGKITSDARIRASLPTIKIALAKGAKLIVASHLGRPNEGEYNEDFSLLPIVNYLQKYLNNTKVILVKDYLSGMQINTGELVILENVRFNKGEKKNDTLLSQSYAALCDIFVMDAFASAHRYQSSTYGIIKYAPISCAGPLLCAELDALTKIMNHPERPLVAIIGGSKISTKFDVLQSLVKIADTVIVGGGISNTFLAIENNVGNSLYEPDFVNIAKKLRDEFNIITPIDVKVSKEFSENVPAIMKKINNLSDNEEIMDFGEQTIKIISNIIKEANTILWNGPLGVFEFPHFRKGTEAIANAIANSKAFSVIGGGDTIAAIELFQLKDKISYISTGGGAFLNFLEGRTLPAVTMLENRVQTSS